MWPSHPATPGIPFCVQSTLNRSATGARASAFRPVIPRRYYLADYFCQYCCSLSDSGSATGLITWHHQPGGFVRPISSVADAQPILYQVDTSRETHAHASATSETVTRVSSPNLAARETVVTDQTNTSEMSDTGAIDHVGKSLNSNDSNKASDANSPQLTNRKTTKTGRLRRTTFSLEQLRIMRERFDQSQYISRGEATELAKELKIRVGSLLDWFGNERTRTRYPSRVGRPQRKRFSPEQIRVMSERFRQNRYISREVAAQLANELNIKTQSLLGWFTNERKRTRHLVRTSNPNRTVFSPEQLQVMRERFAQDCYINQENATKLAEELNIKTSSLLAWFANTRKRTEALVRTGHPNRTIFSPEQLRVMLERFEQNHYINRKDATRLAEELNIGISSLLVWFVNKRRQARTASRLVTPPCHQDAAECLPKHD